jgi:hypothetical protein
MAYLSGQGATLSFGTEGWDGHITRIRHKQTLDHTQVKVMGVAFASTVTGAYHTVYTIDFAVEDTDLAAADLAVGTDAALAFTYASPDKLALTSGIVTDIEVNADVEGAILGTVEIQGNSAMAHTVT